MALPNSHYEKRGPDEVCIDDALPFEIPENWTWARLSSACVSIADGDHQPPPQVQDGIPFLVISNVSDGRVDFSDTRYVPKEYFDSLAEIRIPQCGDLLFTVTGSYGIVIPVHEALVVITARLRAVQKGRNWYSTKNCRFGIPERFAYSNSATK